MNEISDRRKESRKKLMAFTPVYEQPNGTLLGYIQDLTLVGVLVIGEKKVDANTQTTLSFELPGGLTAVRATQLVISARVAHCEQDKNSQTYKIGFEFTDVNPEQVEVLQALLERYHFRHQM
jgi:hypothetical protein